MLISGHEIISGLTCEQLWAELVVLESLDQWSPLGSCISTQGDQLQPAASYLCVHDAGQEPIEANVIVTTFEPSELLSLTTCTTMATLEEHLLLAEHPQGCLVTYSADATSGAFGPAATFWLRHHVNTVCMRLQAFARGRLVE
ncbi:hypothetical protein ACHAAC_13770 [Aeromicrobium sp. CF4.19]|uniref:hypothetical protein n=1 Tax=Aeromicrobium sp. CF4.19 TaxID=3373082 RepID=UPI003EE4B827